MVQIVYKKCWVLIQILYSHILVYRKEELNVIFHEQWYTNRERIHLQHFIITTI